MSRRWNTLSRRLLSPLVAVAVTAGLLVSMSATAPAAAQPNQAVQGAASAATLGRSAPTAVDMSQFRAGNIISDAIFYNGAAMNEGQVQDFLNSQVTTCRSGYVCLKDKTDQTRWIAADPMCRTYEGGGVESAARIITKVAQACGLNPQVLIVMLQKEQGLVTDTYPYDSQYRIAMGQGCPDTAGCDSAYYGFFNQVYGAARQLRRYENPPGTSNFFTWYAPGRTWNILYHPPALVNGQWVDQCGSSPVYIENKATSALYYYTPYQPNAASLLAVTGEGDGCSSYGNRNFFRFFHQWFGSAQPDYCAAPREEEVAAVSGIYVVTADALNARRAPDERCGTGVITLSGGEMVVRRATYGEWVRVDAHGRVAWVHSRYIAPVNSQPTPTLDLDGASHLFAAGSDGTIWAYPYAAPARWGSAVALARNTGMRSILGIGDFDRDGHRDLIGVDASGDLWLFRGDGSSLGTPTKIDGDWRSVRLMSAAGDVDGDGIPDLVGIQGSSLMLWRGDGKGGFQAGERAGRGWGSMTALVGGSDFTGDGNTDIIARDDAGVLRLYPGTGSGGFGAAINLGRGWTSMAAFAAIGDFTGDGKPDLVARHNDGALHLYRGTGGGLAHVAPVGSGWGGMVSLAGPGAPVVSPPFVRDIDGDGGADVLAVAPPGLTLYRGDGRGGWAGTLSLATDWPAGAKLVSLGDFSGTGHVDVARIEPNGRFVLLPGAGDGRVGPPRSIGNGWGTFTSVIGGIDFDGDGHVDVIARDSAGRLLLYRGDGAGGWLGGGQQIGRGWGGFVDLTVVGDFAGDGTADILARSTDGRLWLYSAQGDGTWTPGRVVGRGWSGMTSLVGTGDFDGDGRPDVIARTAAGALLLYRGNGAGGFSGSVQIGRGWAGFEQVG
ncbi:VCBS repeat-containing protein [Microbacterium sp. BDGP8]|uniref:VCBS repeat-containing protein n=1 Tax=unclassified Microbacterium TaxID=2609290 RepID=UPI00249EC097|nr:VCBS repeat-containing protein [Microbacterium sp. BDGP8]WHE35503.1 VCBS repeat-containing protein [Microbacterium sp. BDGP8]